MKKEPQKEIELQEFNFPAEGVTIQAKNLEAALDKLEELKKTN